MRLYKRIINYFSFIVIFISVVSIIINFNGGNFFINYYTQISIILAALGIISFQNCKKYKWLGNRHYLLNYKTFVDRQKQIKELLDILNGENSIINIFGIDGIGVSETLCFSADLINKQIPFNIRIRYYKSFKALLPSRDIAFYFKIININSKEQLIKELYENMFISSEKGNISIIELITLINKKAGRKKLVLMFDEIENKLQMSLIEEFIMLYLQFRAQDIFFIGSHKKNPSYHLTYQFVEILKFNKEELYILAKAYNVYLKENEKTKLFELSQGIPVYAYLLLRYYNIDKQLCKDNLVEYLKENILDSLDERQKEIISKLALLSKQFEEINCCYLPKIVTNFNNKELKSLENKALIAINRQNNTVSILPIVSDQVILYMNNTAFANKLYIYHQKAGNDSLAVMYLLLSDINKEDTYYFNKIVDQYLQQNDMLSLYNLLRVSIDLNIDIYSKSPNIYKKYALASITMLLSCGEYKQAQNIFKEFMINTSCFITLKTPLPEETFLFYFLWADTKHLLNHYSDAINIIDELIICENLNNNHLCQLYWMKAHCLRHQGKDFYESLKYYKVCYELSNKINNVEYIIRALHGMICIAFIIHDITFDFKEKFNELDILYDKTEKLWNTYRYNTLKYKSIYMRLINKEQIEAESLLEQSLNGYKKMRRRNVYDVYFEFGELYRFFDRNKEAIVYYTKCIEFAQNNSDYNLQSLGQMGVILSRLSLKEKIEKSLILEELQTISITAEEKELFLNKHYSKLLIEKLKKKENSKFNILLFNP